MSLRRLSLSWKIWLSTALVLTALFATTGFVLERYAVSSTTSSLEGEVQASFAAYDSLWQARAETLGSIAGVLSSMPNIRAAFGTGDPGTIRDSAREVWSMVSQQLRESSFAIVTDPLGGIVATLEDAGAAALPDRWTAVGTAARRFPAQSYGFFVDHERLYQVVITPVYVDGAQGASLINVLVAGYAVNDSIARKLKQTTGGSDFVFFAPGRVFATSLDAISTRMLTEELESGGRKGILRASANEYLPRAQKLLDVEGKPVGTLVVIRSFAAAREGIEKLRRGLLLLWLAGLLAALLVTFFLARRIVKPLADLDAAAAEVAQQNYDARVEVEGDDELARLGRTFNSMCTSIQSAREDLIRHERMSTIGRMATSIVHDLRNPLAAIYGGAEMLVDGDLPPAQARRLAVNIYQSSRRIQDLLSDLMDVNRGLAQKSEVCRLHDVVLAAIGSQKSAAQNQNVDIDVQVSESIELPLAASRVERVFVNMISNSLEAMPDGGSIKVRAHRDGEFVRVEVSDSGPGIPDQIWDKLFQPFSTYGKKNGLGLGLALSRQAVLEHGGDIWVERERSRPGAHFFLRFPMTPGAVAAATDSGLTTRR